MTPLLFSKIAQNGDGVKKDVFTDGMAEGYSRSRWKDVYLYHYVFPCSKGLNVISSSVTSKSFPREGYSQ